MSTGKTVSYRFHDRVFPSPYCQNICRNTCLLVNHFLTIVYCFLVETLLKYCIIMVHIPECDWTSFDIGYWSTSCVGSYCVTSGQSQKHKTESAMAVADIFLRSWLPNLSWKWATTIIVGQSAGHTCKNPNKWCT